MLPSWLPKFATAHVPHCVPLCAELKLPAWLISKAACYGRGLAHCVMSDTTCALCNANNTAVLSWINTDQDQEGFRLCLVFTVSLLLKTVQLRWASLTQHGCVACSIFRLHTATLQPDHTLG